MLAVHKCALNEIPGRQRGLGLLLFVFVISSFMMTFLGVLSLGIAKQAAAMKGEARQAYFEEAAGKVRAYYEGEHIYFADGRDISEAQLFRELGLERRYRARLYLTGYLESPGEGLKYRNLHFWMPGDGDPDDAIVTSTEVLFPEGSRSDTYVADGLLLAREALGTTLEKMERIAENMRSRAEHLLARDPAHNLYRNYFLADGCPQSEFPGDILPDSIRCTNGSYVMAENAEVGPALGMLSSDLLDAWGNPIHLSNTVDANTRSIPFTAILSVTTPWGRVLTYTVYQKI